MNADEVDAGGLHPAQVLHHQLPRRVRPVPRVLVVAVDALHPERLSVQEDPPAPDHDFADAETGRGFVAAGQHGAERVQVGRTRRPAPRGVPSERDAVGRDAGRNLDAGLLRGARHAVHRYAQAHGLLRRLRRGDLDQAFGFGAAPAGGRADRDVRQIDPPRCLQRHRLENAAELHPFDLFGPWRPLQAGPVVDPQHKQVGFARPEFAGNVKFERQVTAYVFAQQFAIQPDFAVVHHAPEPEPLHTVGPGLDAADRGDIPADSFKAPQPLVIGVPSAGDGHLRPSRVIEARPEPRFFFADFGHVHLETPAGRERRRLADDLGRAGGGPSQETQNKKGAHQEPPNLS